MEATVGRIVHYYPGELDAGAKVNNADKVPAIIVSVHGDYVNLRVFQDGDGKPLWRTSICKKDMEGRAIDQPYWDWPERV